MDADNIDYEDTYDEDAVDETEKEEVSERRSSPLRIILLVLVVLVLLCVVCWLGSQFLGAGLVSQIQGLVPGSEMIIPVDTPISIVATEEPQPEQTNEVVMPPEEPAPTDESMLPTEEPVPAPTDEEPAPPEPTQEPAEPTEEATEAPVEESTEEPTQEPGEPTATTEPVPGPTSTPTMETEPTIVITPSSCEDNAPPVAVANGPYQAMMGKGQANITFDAAGSEDPDGAIIKFEWDFGDGSELGTGDIVTHGYTHPGNYVAILTVTDNCNAVGQDTAEVTISGPTPPAETVTPGPGTPTPTATATPEPPPGDVTLGYCYIVQYGDTLSGIAWYYGISIHDLAAVNNVSTDYFVKLGEGLFIPFGPITDGPNGYQVQYGDTVYSIAYQCAVTPATVAEANDIAVDTTLTPGEVIIIPIGRY